MTGQSSLDVISLRGQRLEEDFALAVAPSEPTSSLLHYLHNVIILTIRKLR